MRWLLLLLALVLMSCGRPKGSYVGFEPYVDSFVEEGRLRGVDVDVYSVSVSFVNSYDVADRVGECDWDGEIAEITLLKSYWDTFEDEREPLIFHELGHCALFKDHTVCPNVMCPTVLSGYEYWGDRAHYLDVLFH